MRESPKSIECFEGAIVTRDFQSIVIASCGYFIAEEHPEAVVEQLSMLIAPEWISK
ncbi:hypothetical protein HDF17_002949 [Granulicella arctica]|uniref:Uncharacterized protein n=1 Tax=Granulicella arctica TaxID=940613 RepID=A0A7Y9PIP2_9BACT|nr:hypothetical protein [Granulicella arctica]